MGFSRLFGHGKRKQKQSRRRPRPTRLTLELLEMRALVTGDLLMGVPLALASTDGAADTSTMSISPPASSQPLVGQSSASPAVNQMQFSLLVTNDADQAISTIMAGQTFWIDVLVQDTSTGRNPSDEGVTGAYTNLAYDSADATPTGTVTPGPNYPVPNQSPHFDATNSTPGLLKFVQGSESPTQSAPGGFTPLGASPLLLDRVQFTATNAGQLTFQSQTVGANLTTVLDVANSIIDTVPDSNITYGQTSLTVTPAPVASIANASATTGATATTMQFQVTLNSTSSQAITIDYNTQTKAGDTAVAGTDYTAVPSGQVTIAAGQTTSAPISIAIAANAQFQADKTFHVNISSDPASQGLATIDPSAGSALGTIHFTPPTVTVQPGSVTETSSTATTMKFPVTLSAASAEDVTVNYNTASLTGDTAVAGTDYTTVDTTHGGQPLVIPAGSTTGEIDIPILAGSAGPTPKTFHVQLAATGGTLAESSVLGTINDNIAKSTISVADSTFTNGSSGGNMPFTVTLSSAVNHDVTVDYLTQIQTDDTAVAGTNFTAITGGQVTIPANQTSANFNIAILGTPLPDELRTFHVVANADAASSDFAVGSAMALGTINDPLPQPTLTVQPGAVTETTSTPTTMKFAVTLSGPSNAPVTVTYTTVHQAADTAVGGVDYTGVNPPGNSVVIPAGSTTGEIDIPILAEVPGADKTFHVQPIGATNATLGVGAVLGTIHDSVQPSTISVGNASFTNGPAGGNMVFTASLNAPMNHDITVDYKTQLPTGDTAVAGTDFTAVTNGQVTIPANQTSATFDIPILSTSASGVTKTFHVAASVDAGSTNFATGSPTAVGTIDDEAAPTISVADATFTNSASGGNMQFTIALSAAVNHAVTVDLNTELQQGDTAVAAKNFTAVANGQVTIPANTLSAMFPVSILGTSLPDIPRTFHFTASVDANSTSFATGSVTAQGTINDPLPQPTLSVQAGAVTETTSTATTMKFAVTLSTASNAPVTLNYATASQSGDTAVAGTDYTSVDTTQSGSPLVIPAGSTTGEIDIPILAELPGATTKTFHLQLVGATNATLAASSVTGTITNDVQPSTISIPDSTFIATSTPGNMQFTVSLNAPMNHDITIDYNTVTEGGDTAHAGVDFTTTNGKVTIPANQTSAPINVPILAASTISATGKTFHLTASVDANSTSFATGSPAATGTISTEPQVTIDSNASVTETTSASATMAFTVHLVDSNNQPLKSDTDVTVQYQSLSQTGDTAVGGPDVTAQGVDYLATTATLTIPAGSTSGTINIPIAAELAGPDKTFHVNLLQVTSGDAQLGAAAAVSAVGTIHDQVPPVVTVQPGAVTETTSTATPMTFAVTLSAASTSPVTLTYNTASLPTDNAVAGTDYTAQSATPLVIPAGSTTGTISIPILGETPGADKTFHLQLSATGGTLTQTTVLGTITDSVPKSTISVGNSSFTVGASDGNMQFTVSLNAAMNHDVVVDYSTQTPPGDTAVAGTDFTAVTNGQVTILANQLSTTINIPIIGTTSQAPPKTFHVAVSVDPASAAFATGSQTVQGTINHPNTPNVVIDGTNAVVTETTSASTTMPFTVSLQDATGKPTTSDTNVTVKYQSLSLPPGDTAQGGASLATVGVDYLATTSTVVIPAGQSSATISIPIGAELADNNAVKTFHVNLLGVTAGDGQLGTVIQATGTINDQVAPPTATIHAASLAAPAGIAPQNMTFTVTLSAASDLAVVFNISTTDGTAKAGTDYTAPSSSATVSISPHATSGTFTVAILPDATLGVNKTFSVTLTPLANNASNATIATAQATGTILAAQGSFAGSVYVDTNNDGQKEAGEHGLAGVTVTLAGTNSLGQAVHVVQTTAADGSFVFQHLAAGSYTVTETPPSQYVVGHATPGAGASSLGNTEFSFSVVSGASFTNDNFAVRGLQPQSISKRLFLGSVVH